MLDIPDQAQTLAVVALFAHGPTTIRGVHTLRVKETDRVSALAAELKKFGATVDVGQDEITVHPPAKPQPATIDTYDDHRMAMSFAIAGTKIANVTIRNVECVNKTYPAFFEDLKRIVDGS
jgi:3-phosphoshikimate 1-carboxyvinyltransferase